MTPNSSVLQQEIMGLQGLKEFLVILDGAGHSAGILLLRSGTVKELARSGRTYALSSPASGLVYIFDRDQLRAIDPVSGRTVSGPVTVPGWDLPLGTATTNFHYVSQDGQRIYINITDSATGKGWVECRNALDLSQVLGRIPMMRLGVILGELAPGIIVYTTGQDSGRGVARHRLLDFNRGEVVAETDVTIALGDSPLEPVIYHGAAFADGKSYYFLAYPTGPTADLPPGPSYVVVVEGNPPVVSTRRQMVIPVGWELVGSAQVASKGGGEIYMGLSTPDRRYGREIRALAVLDTATLTLSSNVIELPEPVSDLAVRGRKVYGVGKETRQIIEVDGASKVATRLPARVSEKRVGHLLGVK